MPSFLDIAPAKGRGLLFAQGLPGGYNAIDDRRAGSDGLQEGALTAGAYKVTAGAGLTLAVATDQGGFRVQGDDIAYQALYAVAPTAVAATLDLATSPDPTNPRIDQVVLEARDDEARLDGITRARVYVLSGTPTAGATLDNRNGAAALPASTARLADVLIPAGAASIAAGNIRDRRAWARGAHLRIVRTANAAGADDYRKSSGVVALIDPVNLQPRIECSGAPLAVTLTAGDFGSLANLQAAFALFVDGADAGLGTIYHYAPPTANSQGSIPSVRWYIVPAAGSRRIGPAYASDGVNTYSLVARAAQSLVLTVHELVRQDASNN